MLTYEEQEKMRSTALAEKGTMPPCPFCKVPRVERFGLHPVQQVWDKLAARRKRPS